MKKNLPRKIIKNHVGAFFLSAITALSVSFAARADIDPNQLLAFKKIYVEPIQDNVDGAFREPIEQSFKEVFDRNPRFELAKDPSAADSVIRTIVKKQTSGTEVEISLIAKATEEIFSSDHISIPSESTGRETGTQIKALLKTTLKRVPFYGTITGRDGQELTFDIGAAHGLKKGDVIQISRVDHVKRHPLLKTIVDVQLVPVGSAALDEVEDVISFGHVANEIVGERIQRLYKVTAIESSAPVLSKKKDDQEDEAIGGSSPVYVERERGEKKQVERPHIGYVGLGAFVGSFSGSTTSNLTSTSFGGSAFNPGFRLSTEIWLTKNWFADLSLGFSTMSYRQTNTAIEPAPEGSGVGATTRHFSFNGGYKYLVDRSIYGPQVFGKIGFANFNWSVPIDATTLQGPKSYSGLNLGIGGSLPIRGPNQGLLLNANIWLFSGLSEETYKTGSQPSSTVANFFLGGYYYFSPQVSVRAGFQFEVYSADFDNGQASTSQKAIGFLPSLQYYF